MCDTSPSILVVEDEEVLADLYGEWLQECYAAETVYDGDTALERLEETGYDIVVLDRKLPTVSGDEVLEEIRERDHDCFVALVTSVTPARDIVNLEFDEYVAKPVAKSDLHEMVDRLTQRHSINERLNEAYRISSKLGALESSLTDEELAEYEEYKSLQNRLETLQAEVTDDIADLSVQVYKGLMRDIARNPQEQNPVH